VTSSFANFFSVLTSLVYGNDGLTGNKASIHTLSPLFFHTALLHAVPKFQGVFIACYPFLMKNDGPYRRCSIAACNTKSNVLEQNGLYIMLGIKTCQKAIVSTDE
jgi:hypothetical protein